MGLEMNTGSFITSNSEDTVFLLIGLLLLIPEICKIYCPEINLWNCTGISNDTDLIFILNWWINPQTVPGPTFPELPGCISISQPAALQFALSSPHHYNALKQPLAFMDFILSISFLTSATFVLSLSLFPLSVAAPSLSQDMGAVSQLKIFFFSVIPPLQLNHPFLFLSDLILTFQFIYPISDNNLPNNTSSLQFCLLNSGLATCWHSQLLHPVTHQQQTPRG